MGFRYKISVVIPVYNCGEYLEACVESLKKQTMRSDDFQIIFVNDGSTDNSAEICNSLAERNSNIVYFEKENGGVSSARNKGIELAKGKYILFLDADDTLTSDTLKKVYKFFEKHYDETDLVTYKIVPYRDGQALKAHYRYNFLKKTGVYDLNDEIYRYIVQSTMNICVKNCGDSSEKFNTELIYHEDMEYCWRLVKKKLTIGFVAGPEYKYLRHSGSTTGSKSNAYYIFESTTAMWERHFDEYEGRAVPQYLQALFLNDINWKGVSDILLPYHYDEKDFGIAKSRLLKLLSAVDDDVIIRRPSMDLYHKYYLLGLKGSNSVSFSSDDGKINLIYDGEPLYSSENITAVVTHFSLVGGKVNIDAFLKSPAFSFVEMPELYLVADGKRKRLELTHSQHEHYHSNIKNSIFWRFNEEIDISEIQSFHFETVINGTSFNTICYHKAPYSPFTQGKNFKAYRNDGFIIKEKNGNFTVKKADSLDGRLLSFFNHLCNCYFYFVLNPRVLYNRFIAYSAQKNAGRSWIYLDRYGLFDNAYLQFKHDFAIKDGVKRYYILNECDLDAVAERFTQEEKKNVILFHSSEHKRLYFACEKLITGFSNLSNVCPFGGAAMKWYQDLTHYEMIYLQHGILHASLMKMYAREFCVCDRVAVSSSFEIKNFTENYGYTQDRLIKSCMPRYDEMQISGEKKNRILFSPSWRSNLIGALINNERAETPEAFLASDFYKQVSAFLNSEKLHSLLEKNNLYLDFQNHPIFKCYNHLFEITNDRVSTEKTNTKQDEYRLMITDYSSIVFDSVYLNCPIIYFVPDYDLFLAGVSHNYRRLDLPLENGFGPFAHDADELIAYLEEYIENGFAPKEPYASRMKDFFLYRDNSCCDRLYEAIK